MDQNVNLAELSPKRKGRPPKYTSEEQRLEARRKAARNYSRKHYQQHSAEINKKQVDKYRESRINYPYKIHSKYTREFGIYIETEL